MDSKKIGEYLQWGSYVIGSVAVFVLIVKLPIVLILAAVGAGLYFVGQYFKSQV